MPISIDEVTRRKLAIVKQVYQQAFIQSSPQNSFVAKLMSVLGFDLAIEAMLKTVISAVNPSKSPSDAGFNSLIQQANDCLTKANLVPIPDEANIRHVHSIRNDTQHKAKYPDDTGLSDCRTYTRDFLQKISGNIWGVSFEEIRLSELVKYEKVKEFLKTAEVAFENNDYQEVVNQAAAGLTLTLHRVQEPIVGKIEQSDLAFVMEDGFHRVGVDKNTYHSFRRIQETLLIMVLGMDYANYVRYKSLAPAAVFRGDGSVVFHGFNAARKFTDEEAEFVLSYCIDAVVQIENRVGSVDNPFEGKAPPSSRLIT